MKLSELKLSPENISEYYKTKAEILLKHYRDYDYMEGNLEKALEFIEKALENTKDKLRVLFYLQIKSEIFLNKKDFEFALEINQQAFNLFRDHSEIEVESQQAFYGIYYWLKAKILYELNQENELLKVLDEAIELDYFTLYDKISFLTYEVIKNDKVLDILNKLIKKDSKNPVYLELKADVLI